MHCHWFTTTKLFINFLLLTGGLGGSIGKGLFVEGSAKGTMHAIGAKSGGCILLFFCVSVGEEPKFVGRKPRKLEHLFSYGLNRLLGDARAFACCPVCMRKSLFSAILW